jgi:hypothetical protein
VTAARAAILSLHINAAKASFEVEPRKRPITPGTTIAARGSGLPGMDEAS